MFDQYRRKQKQEKRIYLRRQQTKGNEKWKGSQQNCGCLRAHERGSVAGSRLAFDLACGRTTSVMDCGREKL